MPKLEVRLKNCYGIRELDEEFKFDTGKNVQGKCKSYAIYASNGAMKSSFADTFWAVQEQSKNDPRDRMYPERKTEVDIKWDGNKISSDNIYVVKTLDEKVFNEPPAGVARLLVNEKLKKEYEKFYKDLETEKDSFITKLKKVSGSSDCEPELLSTFSEEYGNSIYEVLQGLLGTITDNKHQIYTFKYNDVFDKTGKVKEFTTNNKELLQDYADTYNKLLSESTFFNGSSSFGTYQAKEIGKGVKDDEFFSAGHRFRLKEDGLEVESSQQFSEIINKEIERIVSDKSVRQIFTKIDTALQANQNLRNFQKALDNDNSIAAKLADYDGFKAEVWYGFLSEVEDEFVALVKSYKTLKPELDKIVAQAEAEQQFWKDAIEEFNRRFKKLPFRLDVVNRKDVVLNSDAPTIDFVFDDKSPEGSKTTNVNDLKETLSHGEMRALHLLSIIFDVKAREADKKDTLFVIDDAVDSFDYKNKYAIVQYLKDITNVDNFYVIMLTHNFDFFRTIESRGIVNYNDCKLSYRDGDKTRLKEMVDFKNPFSAWKNDLNNDESKLIASIPFARNLIEYTKGVDDSGYTTLCSVLHVRDDSGSITLQELNNILASTFPGIDLPANSGDSLYDLIIVTAKSLADSPSELALHEKIVLSIASRLVAESFARDNIKTKSKEDIDGQHNPTSMLFEVFKNENAGVSIEVLNALDDVLLMTPENIHLNAFMYEPIIDLGSDELKELFIDTERILK